MSSKDSKDSVEVTAVEKTKHRRTLKVEKQSVSESNSAHDVKPSKSQLDASIAKAVRGFYYEEEEASRRDPADDLELHGAVCGELRRVMARVQQLKSAGTESSDAAELEELRVHGSLQFLSLKKLNRITHFRAKKVRDSTNEAKVKVDQHHLKLQNLLYEVAHLQKEINKCLQFKSKDEEITLIPAEQFYNEAPADISKPSETRNDPHQLTLARLHWELEQRKRLSSKLQDVATQKDRVLGEITTKKDYLESLQPKLSTILQATKPVQEHLGMPFDLANEQRRTASYLPSPLYVLYVQTRAYAEACDKSLSVSIQGDTEVAQTMQETPVIIDEDVENDDVDEVEKTAEVRRRRTSSMRDKAHRLLLKHPLSVCLQVNCPDKSLLSLTFYYLVSLNICTVCVKLTPYDTACTVSGGDLLQPDTLLSCLYPDDAGHVTPNPSNSYVLSLGDFTKYVNEVGFPYHWVQSLCGLQFLPEDPHRCLASVSASHMAETIKRLRRRVRDRLSLQKQLSAFEQGLVPVTSEYMALYPTKICSRLTQWKRTTFQDFVILDYTKRLVDMEFARPDDLYFTGTIQRETVTLTVHVVVSTDYPTTASQLVLCLQWHGTQHTALNDDGIRDMESEVNVYYDELGAGDKTNVSILLTNQIQRLLVCLDVYLETSGTGTKPEFSQERICSRLARGRSRTRPYKYNSQLCFFSQR